MKPVADSVFKIGRMNDPFLDNPFVAALLKLTMKERKLVVRQVTLLCLATDLDPEGALELLAQVAPYLEASCH